MQFLRLALEEAAILPTSLPNVSLGWPRRLGMLHTEQDGIRDRGGIEILR
jgi:hypothetical protein